MSQELSNEKQNWRGVERKSTTRQKHKNTQNKGKKGRYNAAGRAQSTPRESKRSVQSDAISQHRSARLFVFGIGS